MLKKQKYYLEIRKLRRNGIMNIGKYIKKKALKCINVVLNKHKGA